MRAGRAFPIRAHTAAPIVAPTPSPLQVTAFVVHSPRRLRVRLLQTHHAAPIVGAAVVSAPVRTVAFVVHPLSQRRQRIRLRPHLASTVIVEPVLLMGATFTAVTWQTAYGLTSSWQPAYSMTVTWGSA